MDSSKLFPMIGILIWSAVALTAAPRALSHRHPVELSVKGDEPIRACSDLNVSFENRRAIEHFGNVSVIGDIPILENIDRAALLEVFEKYFDHQAFR